MKQEDSFAGWNFTGVWDIREGSGYPTLQWEQLENKAIIKKETKYDR